jgi:hypothetical protein
MHSQEPTILELKGQIEAQGKAIEEIRASQIKVANALLGSFERDGVGLLEQQRTNVTQIAKLHSLTRDHDTQIVELIKFRDEIKKMVAIIAVGIPIVFEIVKALCIVGWELFVKK